jgi:hypothetical protein
MSRAQIERRLTFAEARLIGPRCNNLAVLRKFADHYLVVAKNNRHALIDESCKAIFLLDR